MRYCTINRFRIVSTNQALIKHMYLTFNQQLQDQGLIDYQFLFVYGMTIGPRPINTVLSGEKRSITIHLGRSKNSQIAQLYDN